MNRHARLYFQCLEGLRRREVQFQFLDSLQRLGITNIRYAVAPHLMLKFNLSKDEAAQVLSDWLRVTAAGVAHG
jgi:hypothetical protein